MIKFELPSHTSLNVCSDLHATKEGAYGAGVGSYNECSNDCNVLAADHDIQPTCHFFCFDIHASGTLKSLFIYLFILLGG